ncbi:type VII secretion-associated serine protease mycosin, partial [Lysinibacillus fusiformis]|uniref:type VII secretion-associated serine protease mycosin n=1 Tax=Lysinibacillus fusiformis TaxID=28031 RepID=UPI00381A95F4
MTSTDEGSHRMPRTLIRTWSTALACMGLAVLPVLTVGQAHADPAPLAHWPLDPSHFDAEKVWTVSRGQGVIVGVVDSGVAAAHPDLTGQVIAGTSLLGDQGDGRTDNSEESHGTAIAGIIAGSGGPDRRGMIGLAPSSQVMPIRVSADKIVTPQALAGGIVWAVDHGARVVNVSIGCAEPHPMLRQAVEYAARQDVIVVASAGNQGKTGNPPQYPAAFPGVVSVSGTDRNGHFWDPSESGAGIVLAAPAEAINSTSSPSSYASVSGTSYAAAYVSATAALLRSHYPTMTAGQIIRRMIETASEHRAVPDSKLGYGIINPFAALTDKMPLPAETANPLLDRPQAASESSWPTPLRFAVGTIAASAAAVALLMAFRWRRIRSTGS